MNDALVMRSGKIGINITAALQNTISNSFTGITISLARRVDLDGAVKIFHTTYCRIKHRTVFEVSTEFVPFYR